LPKGYLTPLPVGKFFMCTDQMSIQCRSRLFWWSSILRFFLFFFIHWKIGNKSNNNYPTRQMGRRLHVTS
jgi:hypothetical protein